MTEVFFYISQDIGEHALFALTQRLTQAAWQRQRRVYIYCRDAEQCQQLDDWLWSTPHTSFLPHGQDQAVPVRLGWQDVPTDQHDVLINLTTAVPDFFSRFERVAEPVVGADNEREAARARWRHYQSRGYPVQKHDL